MKCLVIGHTSGIGKSIYNTFNSLNYDTAGISRSNGYDIVSDYDKIYKLAQHYDLVINNVCVEDYQCKLLCDLNNKVKYIISIGSTSGYYYNIVNRKKDYTKNKQNLIELNRQLSFSSTSNLLVLNIGLTENASPDPGCSYNDIVKTCLFWLSMPNINQIDFSVKLSDVNTQLIEKDFDIQLKNFKGKFF